ncbi:copper-binding protein [Acidovorax sp. NPDC077693]|uniref:copper-binding protein n=1 Tax=unclassified Acidovorax TaxID=2684926 RepID=UPI0037C791EB
MTNIAITLAASLLILASAPVLAQAPAQASAATASDSHSAQGAHGTHSTHSTDGAQQPASAAAQAPLSEGEITRWDPRTLRVTLRHGEIQNLQMPPMTMVFRVQDAGVVGSLQAGDKVRFRAEQVGGAYQVVHIEKAP